MNLIRSVRALAVLAGFFATSAPSAQAIQLKDGELLVGEILEATSEGLSFRRLDSGGVLDLVWSDLSPLHAARIKRLQGLVVENEAEPMIEVDAIEFGPAGALPEEVIGVVVEQTPTHYKLRRKTGDLTIRRDSIKRVRRVSMPVTEVYSPKEWYERKLAEIAPGQDADKHIALAEHMRLARDWDHAEQHLLEAQKLGGGRQTAVLPQMLQHVKTQKDSAAERDHLSRIRVMRNRGEFERALALIDEFGKTWPQSRIQADFEAEKKRVADAQERDFVEKLGQNWDRTLRAVATDKIAEKGVTFAAARTWAEEKMVDEVFARLGKLLGVESKDARALWARRNELGKRGSDLYSYGIGSWLLGPERVVAGTKSEGANDPKGQGAATANDAELERTIRRLREAADRARRAAQNRSAAEQEEETDEQWWSKAERDDKVAWIRSYFAEFGGQTELVLAVATPCLNCGGRGTVVSIGTTGDNQQLPCPLCHRTRFVRSIRAR